MKHTAANNLFIYAAKRLFNKPIADKVARLCNEDREAKGHAVFHTSN